MVVDATVFHAGTATNSTEATLATTLATLATTLTTLATTLTTLATTLTTLATALSTRSTHEREGEEFLDDREVRRHGQSDVSAIRRDEGLDLQRDPVIGKSNLWLISDGKRTDDRSQRCHIRPRRNVLDKPRLSVEQCHLRGTHNVAALITLSGIDKEECFNVAEYGEAKTHAGVGIESAKVRHTDAERALSKRDVRVLCKCGGASQSDRFSIRTVAGARDKLTRRRRTEERSTLRRLLSLLSALLSALLTTLLLLGRNDGAERWNWDQTTLLPLLALLTTTLTTLLTASALAAVQLRSAEAAGQVEVEVDADSFKEVVRHRDEADFDSDLEVLQATKLFQQVAEAGV